jgi:hypothetical protein
MSRTLLSNVGLVMRSVGLFLEIALVFLVVLICMFHGILHFLTFCQTFQIDMRELTHFQMVAGWAYYQQSNYVFGLFALFGNDPAPFTFKVRRGSVT